MDRVHGLLHAAGRVYAGGPAEPALRVATARLGEPLRVAIAGRIKAGKSTLLNALVGHQLAATDAGECTRVVTWYVDGVDYRAMVHPRGGGPARQLPFRRTGGAVEIDLDGVPPATVDRLVVSWPSETLRRMTLVDTPGLGSADAEVSARGEAVLAPGNGEVADADAVVYLMRHVHSDDAAFLEAFRDASPDHRTITTIGVLARADEVGHARPDALASAARVAARYRADPRVNALCRTVVPVAGLLAASAAGLRESDHRALALLAGHEDADRLLRTADRLVTAETTLDLPGAARRALVARFGLFGVRRSVALIREHRARTASDLARALAAESGVAGLQELLATQFTARADVLKARSALAALDAVLHRHPVPAAGPLVAEAERLRAGAHEFAELSLVDDLRSRRIRLGAADSEATRDAERLLGASGPDVRTRLALDPATDAEAVRHAAGEQHRRWQRRAEHPATTREVARAARVLVRTCEGLLAVPPRP